MKNLLVLTNWTKYGQFERDSSDCVDDPHSNFIEIFGKLNFFNHLNFSSGLKIVFLLNLPKVCMCIVKRRNSEDRSPIIPTNRTGNSFII